MRQAIFLQIGSNNLNILNIPNIIYNQVRQTSFFAKWFQYSKYKEPDVPGQPDSGEMSPTEFADGVVSGKEKK